MHNATGRGEDGKKGLKRIRAEWAARKWKEVPPPKVTSIEFVTEIDSYISEDVQDVDILETIPTQEEVQELTGEDQEVMEFEEPAQIVALSDPPRQAPTLLLVPDINLAEIHETSSQAVSNIETKFTPKASVSWDSGSSGPESQKVKPPVQTKCKKVDTTLVDMRSKRVSDPIIAQYLSQKSTSTASVIKQMKNDYRGSDNSSMEILVATEEAMDTTEAPEDVEDRSEPIVKAIIGAIFLNNNPKSVSSRLTWDKPTDPQKPSGMSAIKRRF